MWAKKSSFAIGALLMLFCAAKAALATGEDTNQAIEYMLAYVARSDCAFIRNGQSYDAQQAAAHLRSKRSYFKAQIHTPEDFIRLAASKSLASGRPYLVRCDATVMPAADWLNQELATFRRQP